MRKFLVLISTAFLMATATPALQANAAVVKTTITISTPSYVFASVPNPIDVAVCSKATFSSQTCEQGLERKVTLWANGVKVQTVTTIGGGGIASFTWTPKRSGKSSLKVTVAPASASLRSANSETKTITVRPKSFSTALGTMSCGTVCVSGLPAKIDLTKDGVITAGIISAQAKNRKVHFQSLRVSNKYYDNSSATSSWQADISKYGMSLAFSTFDADGYCTPGQSFYWTYRFYVDATSKASAAATAAKAIEIVCPPASGNTGDIELNLDYYDQTLDYANESPAAVQVSVSALDTSQYSIYSEYCSKDLDCTDYDNWNWMSYYTMEDEIFGSRDFSLSMDPGDYGDYWVRVHVVPWTDQEEIFSTWYSLSLG